MAENITKTNNMCETFLFLQIDTVRHTFHCEFEKQVVDVEDRESVRLMAAQFAQFYHQVCYHCINII